MKQWSRWRDWTNVALGAWLFVSPWVFAQAGGTAAWNAWFVGLGIVLAALWGLVQPGSKGAEGTNIVLGGWTFFAPWLLGFATVTVASWNASVTGAAVALVAAGAFTRTATTAPRRHA